MNITDKEYTIATDILNKINAYSNTRIIDDIDQDWVIDMIAEGLYQYKNDLLKSLLKTCKNTFKELPDGYARIIAQSAIEDIKGFIEVHNDKIVKGIE